MKWRWIIPLLSMLHFGCERAFMGETPADNPHSDFESLWTTIDERYAFLTYKDIDWDSLRTHYESDIEDGMSDQQLFDVLGNMLYHLEDGHVNLQSPFDVSRNWSWFQDYPHNFDRTLVDKEYLGMNHRRTGPLLNSILDNRVGYIYYGSFSSDISEAHLSYVLNRFRDLDAIIIDIRDNGGGSLENVNRLASRFADDRRHVYDDFYKEGPGHDDFSEAYPFFIQPEGDIRYTRPVYVLTNRKCYSSSTMFAQCMRVFPHVTIVGDSTGGGGGLPISRELPNGWIVRFSSTMTLAPDGYNVEEGIPPDVRLTLHPDSVEAGKDNIIEWVLRDARP